MRSLNGQVTDLLPRLTAKERFLLEMPAYHEGTKPDPKIRETMPDAQAGEFNHYIRLFNRLNRKLGAYAVFVESLIEKSVVRMTMVVSIANLALLQYEVAGLLPASKRAKAEAILSESSYSFDLPWEVEERKGTWFDYAEAIVADVRLGYFERWKAVLALETVLAEVQEELEGEDPAFTELRACLRRTRDALEFLGRLLEEDTRNIAGGRA